jgi:hypothetical protein
METKINIADVQALVHRLQIDDVCREGKVSIVIDGVQLNFVYYWYDNHFELAIMPEEYNSHLLTVMNACLRENSMFDGQGHHIWDQIGFLIDLKFKTQKCIIHRINTNLTRGVTEAQIFQLCDNLCHLFKFKKCQLRTFPNYTHCGIQMSCFDHDLIGLLLGSGYFGSKYAFYGKGDILKPIQDFYTYNMYDVVTAFPNCREMLKTSYEYHERSYFDKELCNREITSFDKNTEKCKELLQTCDVFSIGDFLVWCWNHCPEEFNNMTHLLFPAPIYRGYASATNPFFWIGAFDAIWHYCNSKQKLYV